MQATDDGLLSVEQEGKPDPTAHLVSLRDGACGLESRDFLPVQRKRAKKIWRMNQALAGPV